MARMPAQARRWTPPPARIAGDSLLKAREKQYQQQKDGDSAVQKATHLAMETKAELEAQKRKSSDQAFLQEKIDKIDALLKKMVEETKMIPHVSGGGGRRTVEKLLNKYFIVDNDDLTTSGTKLALRKNVANWVNAKIVDDDNLANNGTKIALRKNVKAWVEDQTDIFTATITTLKALDTTSVKKAYLLDGGRRGHFVWTTGDFSSLITADTANGVYVKADAVSASVGAWVRVHDNEYLAKWFGAKEDGTTNDSAAIQAAINVCLLGARPVPMVLTGPCLMNTGVNIDRQVGTTSGADTFFIRGRGPFAGFKSGLTGSIIDTTLAWIAPFNGTPACNITFESVTFDGTGNVNTLCVSPKFLKVSFESCRFRTIRCTQSPYYLQSWYFNRCSAIGWAGVFVQVVDEIYDLRVHQCDFETGADGFKSFNAGVYGGSLIGNLFQNSGQFFSQGKGEALTILGNYLEGNSTTDFQLSDPINVGSHHGTVFQGNFMALPTTANYRVIVGGCVGMIAGGNSAFSANLYDTTNTVPGSFKSYGDSVGGPSPGTKFSNLGSFDADGAGNFKTASLASGSATSLTTATAKTIISLSLEAGDWDVSGMVAFDPAATTSETAHIVSISTTNNTHGATTERNARGFAAVVTAGFETNMPTPVVRLSLAATTTVYLVASANFTVSTMTAYGIINARRAGGQ